MGELEITDLTKVFRTEDVEELVAVDDLDIHIDDGEFLVLVGPSGCGKTTTLRCIAGLETATEGQVLLDGVDITDEEPADRDMAMVFQNFALYPHMDVRSNMSFGLKLAGELSADEIDAKVERAAEMLEIEALLEKQPDQLSGGQKQRVALGRAIVREPEVFLFDEPLSNLDAKLRTTMRTEIQQLQNQLEVTAVYVTHDQAEAMTMGDRIAVLNNGRLQQLGTPETVYHHPANEFVAGFIGDPSMNFVSARLVADEGSTALSIGDQRYAVSADIADVVGDGDDELTLGIRPEDIEIVATENAPSEKTLTSTVKVVEPLGDENLVYYDIAGTEFVSQAEPRTKPAAGTTVALTFREPDLYLFDRDGTALKTKTELEDVATTP